MSNLAYKKELTDQLVEAVKRNDWRKVKVVNQLMNGVSPEDIVPLPIPQRRLEGFTTEELVRELQIRGVR